MSSIVQRCPNSNRYFALENGFRFDFPNSIAKELRAFLANKPAHLHPNIIGEWILALPKDKRLTVGIQTVRTKHFNVSDLAGKITSPPTSPRA